MKTRWILLLVAFALLTGYLLRAQTSAPYQFSVAASTTSSNCTAVAGQTTYCFTGAGAYISVNGGAFASLSGVTSWNGLTGAVTYTPPTKALVPAVPATSYALQ
jgi:hypothetical protein